MAERPGIMVYLEWAEVVAGMGDAEVGRLFKAILSYGKGLGEPELRGAAAVVWPLIRVRLDQDEKRYNQVCLRNAYNRFIGDCKAKGRDLLDFETWEDTVYNRKRRSTTSVEDG